MTRLLITLMLLVLMIGAAVWEQSYLDRSYEKLTRDLTALTATMQQQIDTAVAEGKEPKDAEINTLENKAKIDNLYNYWKSREKKLAMIVRHFDLAQISDAIIYLKNFVEFNNPEEAFAGAQRLRYLIDAHIFNFGANLQNMI